MKFCLDPCVESLIAKGVNMQLLLLRGSLPGTSLVFACLHLFTYYWLNITHLRGGGYTYGAHFGGSSGVVSRFVVFEGR